MRFNVLRGESEAQAAVRTGSMYPRATALEIVKLAVQVSTVSTHFVHEFRVWSCEIVTFDGSVVFIGCWVYTKQTFIKL